MLTLIQKIGYTPEIMNSFCKCEGELSLIPTNDFLVLR